MDQGGLEHCDRIIQKPLPNPLEKNSVMDASARDRWEEEIATHILIDPDAHK